MKRVVYILLGLLLSMLSYADVTITLLSGQQLSGVVVFQNADVVVIKSHEGQRYQYPMSEVESITEGIVTEEKQSDEIQRTLGSGKKVGISLHLSGGVGILSAYNTGGAVEGNIYIGACNVFKRHVFIGGGVGYTGLFMAQTEYQQKLSYSFIPVYVRFSAPLMQTKHAPALGCSIGYGFSPKGITYGGVSAVADFGWRCQISSKSAIFAGLTASTQQGKIDKIEIIEDTETHKPNVFTSTPVYNFWKIGAKVAIQF